MSDADFDTPPSPWRPDWFPLVEQRFAGSRAAFGRDLEPDARCITDRTAIATLTTGTRLEGRWLSVTPDTFTMLVDAARGQGHYPPGQYTLDRSRLAKLQVRQRLVRGRVLGTVAGIYLPTVGLALAAQENRVRSGWAIAAALGGTLGYQLGKLWDKRPLPVLILRELPLTQP